MIWPSGALPWPPKFLVGQAWVTGGGDLCQQQQMDNHKTVRWREREGRSDWAKANHRIQKKSEKVIRQFIAQWSKKGERWKPPTWVKLRVIARKGNRNIKVWGGIGQAEKWIILVEALKRWSWVQRRKWHQLRLWLGVVVVVFLSLSAKTNEKQQPCY